MGIFPKIVNMLRPLNIFAKSSTLDFWLGYDCSSAVTYFMGNFYTRLKSKQYLKAASEANVSLRKKAPSWLNVWQGFEYTSDIEMKRLFQSIVPFYASWNHKQPEVSWCFVEVGKSRSSHLTCGGGGGVSSFLNKVLLRLPEIDPESFRPSSGYTEADVRRCFSK